MEVCSNNYQSFTGRPKVNEILPKARDAFNAVLPELRSPTKFEYDFFENKPKTKEEMLELNDRLRFVRSFLENIYKEEGKIGYFKSQIGLVKAFNVANCYEFAEIGKTILRMNKIKNADIFALYAKSPNGTIRDLDHGICAINVGKSRNNKANPVPFVAKPNTKIFDMWLNGFIGKVKNARKIYRQIGLKDDEVLMLKPLKTLEPDNKCLNRVQEEFPKLQLS